MLRGFELGQLVLEVLDMPLLALAECSLTALIMLAPHFTLIVIALVRTLPGSVPFAWTVLESSPRRCQLGRWYHQALISAGEQCRPPMDGLFQSHLRYLLAAPSQLAVEQTRLVAAAGQTQTVLVA